MQVFKGIVVSEVEYRVNAEDIEQAEDFILEDFKEDTDPQYFDHIYVKNITEVK